MSDTFKVTLVGSFASLMRQADLAHLAHIVAVASSWYQAGAPPSGPTFLPARYRLPEGGEWHVLGTYDRFGRIA